MGYKIKKIVLLLFIGGNFGAVSAQVTSVLKVGNNPYTINEKAALDVESTTKGFLPPRMTKSQRDAISSPPAGLLVWCTDCNISTEPASGELSVYLGEGWSPFTTNTTPRVTTAKKDDANNGPVRVSSNSATIKGTLVSASGAKPTETGIVWREILDGEFGILPVLDGTGAVSGSTYKTATATPVTTDGGDISVTISSLTSTTSNKKPFYFRAYVKSPLGIGYGNPIVFNCSYPIFSAPTVTNGSTLYPKFKGSVTVNAGTYKGGIAEYGYYSGASASPSTTKVVLSTTDKITELNTFLDSESFTSNKVINLDVDDYNVEKLGTTYFRYFITMNDKAGGGTIYSSDLVFAPVADPITGGTAIATVTSKETISPLPKIGKSSTSTWKVNFNVTRAGTYAIFNSGTPTGATTGLSVPSVAAGSFELGNQSLSFKLSGTPGSSLAGNNFNLSRIGDVNTGAILPADMSASTPSCDALSQTEVVPFTSSTGKVWMDRNLGASRAAISSTDSAAYGCLYQWGRGNDGHATMSWASSTSGSRVYSMRTGQTSSTDTPGHNSFYVNTPAPDDWRSPQNDNLWQGINGTNNPCPAGYRVPTEAEFLAEKTNYGITNIESAYSSFFKIPAAGYQQNNATFYAIGNTAIFWTSSPTGGTGSYTMQFTPSSAVRYANARSLGFSVRCIKN
jgi:uncharacterized protein (TIGR02145 family)